MRVEVTGRHLEITPAISEYAEAKCGKLPRYYDGVQEVIVVLMREPHKERFEVEFQVGVQKHDHFIATAKGEDIYGCIDLATDRAIRQLSDFKEKLKNSKR